MKNTKIQHIIWGLAFLLLFAFTLPAFGADEAPLLSVDQLNERLDSPELVILDVRSGPDWNNSDKKIKGAVRVDSKDVKSWAGNYPKGKEIVLYCA